MENIVTGKNIIKTFGRGIEQAKVLDRVNIEIKKGEFVAVMGPSGSGKSTLLFALSGMDDISDGSVKFGDTELSKLREDELADVRRMKMGFIFQQPNLLPWYTVRENVALPLRIFGLKGQEWEDKVDELIAMVGLTEYANAYPYPATWNTHTASGIPTSL